MRKAIGITILVSILVLLPVWFFLRLQLEGQLIKEQEMQTADRLSHYANTLGKIIQQRFALLDGLSAFVLSSPEREQLDHTFFTFASALHSGTMGIRNFALAPGGTNRYVYPYKGNEKVLGHNLINDPRPAVKMDVQRAIGSRKITLSGPYLLRQGGLGLVARKAVFFKNRFWGLATMVVDMPPVFAEAGLEAPQIRSAVGLRKGGGELFYGSAEAFAAGSVSHRVELPDGFWEISMAAPPEPASHLKRQLKLFDSFSLLAGGLLCALIFFIASRQTYLTRKVKEQTRDLRQRLLERQAAEKALSESEERFRTLIDLSPIGLVLCTMDGWLIKVNPAYAHIIGYSVEESQQLTYWDITPEKYKDQEQEQLDRLRRTGRYGPYEKEYRHKDGQLVPVRLNGLLIRRDGTDYIWSSVEDVTALKKAEQEKNMLSEQLRQSQKMEAIGTLAGGVAHDFNNILAAILGYAELILYSSGCDAKNKKHLEQILKAVARAKELVKQILTFSRRGEEHRAPVKINEVALEAINLLKKTVPSTIAFKVDIESDLGTVMADPTQIHQVIMNLCTNAYHAIPDHTGTISVRLKRAEVDLAAAARIPDLRPGKYDKLTITDTGAGMPVEILDRIFEPFFTTKRQGQGTGMGLAVVHGIVQKHGGAIDVRSEVGTGTTFDVYFPLLADLETSGEGRKADSVRLTGTESILLVDDEVVLVELGQEALESYGYTVTSTNSPVNALNMFNASPDSFDLVITDQTMPEMPGNILAEKILKIRPDIPVIICTGHSAILDEDKVKEIGAKALLMKPLRMSVLTSEVRKILDGMTG